jgi:hypothetical protein
MTNKSSQGLNIFLVLCLLAVGSALPGIVSAQGPEMQQKVADVKEAMAKNKQALGQYTWNEQVTISLKGEEKKQEHFQVRLGPDGKPQKTSLDPPQATTESGGGRLKRHIVAKKKEEYEDYADQIKALIQQYVPPDKDAISQAYQKGNIALSPEAGTPGQYKLVISNYLKQSDNMTLVVDKAQKNLASLSIASYLDDPKDAVNVTVQFSAIPDGPNHVSTETIDGVSKKLTIAIQNSNYQKIQGASIPSEMQRENPSVDGMRAHVATACDIRPVQHVAKIFSQLFVHPSDSCLSCQPKYFASSSMATIIASH